MIDYWTIVSRGLRRRCPKCGVGRIFSGFISLLRQCPECGEPFHNIRTDDAAPWATVLFVGHFSGWLLAGLIKSDLTSNEVTAYAIGFVLICAALTLPVMKGIFVNLNWYSGLRYAAADDSDGDNQDR